MRPNWHSEPVTSKRLHMRRRFNTHTPTPSMPTQSYPHYPQVRALLYTRQHKQIDFQPYPRTGIEQSPAKMIYIFASSAILFSVDPLKSSTLLPDCCQTSRSGPLLWRPCQAGFPVRLAIGCHIPSRSHPTSLIAVTIDRWLPPRTCQEPSGSCVPSPLPICCSS